MKLRHSLAVLALLGTSLRLPADWILQAPAAPLAAGADFEIVLVATNNSSVASAKATPTELRTIAFAGDRSSATVLTATEPVDDTPLAPGAFRRIVYRGRLPADFTGLVVLDATRDGAGRAVLDVIQPPPGAEPLVAAAAAGGTLGGSEAAPTPPPSRDLGLSPHEPIYFSVGGHGGLNARFQLSFKFRPVGPSDDRVAGSGFWEDFYLAYTQTSLWDLHSLSKPFTDSSYRPAVFYHRYDTGLRLFGASLGFAGGVEHESNGKGGADSRSINLLFARPTLRWGPVDSWQFTASPKVYWYLDKEENDDIQRFRGYGDFLFTLEHPRSWKLAATLRAGTSGRGSIQLDATYPFAKVNDFFPLGWVHGYLHLQLFNGWGESLLHYNERAETQFRVGFMAVR